MNKYGLPAVQEEIIMSEDPQSRKDEAGQPAEPPEKSPPAPAKPAEIGGPKGPEPTRYNDWERGGRCIDF